MERESRSLEFKLDVSNLQKLAKTVVAFANGDGGKIIVGVGDRSRAIVGLAPDRIDELLERVPASLADQIQPPVFPLVFERTIEAKEVLVIQVFPCNLKPCFLAAEGIEKGIYIRVGPHTRRAQGELLQELHLLRSRMRYDEEPIPDCPMADLKTDLLPADFRSEKALYSLGVFRRDAVSGKPVPTRGGVLMLHQTPERYVAEASILISRMRGEHGRQTVESQEVTGCIPAQADAAMAILERWLGRDLRRRGARYRPRASALPMGALREAVSNALFHRQYSIPGSIKIALYPSRVEIFNPGHFAGPFVPEELGDGTSYIRNRVICHLARLMGLIEKRGTGIRLMQDSMKEAGLAGPRFEEGQLSFKVVLELARDERSRQERRGYEERVVELLETHPELASSDVCKHLNVSRATAVAILNRLIESGRLNKVGRGPKTRYRASADSR